MSKYPYRPLNLPHETRILTVHPGHFSDAVVCSLSHLTIDSPERPYEALSYCWSKGVDRDPGIDPETEIPWAVYGKDDDGSTIFKSGSTKWKDLVDHPYQGQQYVRMGGKMPDAPIICDNIEVIVGGELFRALRRMRKEDTALRIWVDALCINQDDVEERNEHVKIMGRVYAGASQTRLWLGESTDMDMPAVNTLFAISEIFNELFVTQEVVDHNSSIQEVQWHFFNATKSYRLDWGLLADLLDRAWFKRTWIVQEIANSREVKVHLGEIEFPWGLLARIILALSEYKLQTMISECKAIKAIGYMEHLRKERVDKSIMFAQTPLLTLLEELRDFKATIPSDKIYGILSLTEHVNDLTVDYARSPEAVFKDFAVQQLQSGSLDILTHCVHSSKPTTLTLPSWVPDWTRPGWVEPLRIRELQCSAAGTSKPSFTIDEDSGSLRIKGRLLDTVAAIETKRQIPPPNQQGPMHADNHTAVEDGELARPDLAQYGGPMRREENDEDAAVERTKPVNNVEYRTKKAMDLLTNHASTWYRGVIDVAFPNKTVTPTMWENLWRTFMCNRTRDNKMPDVECATGMDLHYKTLLEEGKGLAQVLQERVDHEIESHGLAPQDAVEYYMKEKTAFETFIGAHTKWTYNRRFFRSTAGRFGWAVEGTEPGDVIAAFNGCDYPFVLRAVGERTYRIVGDCYLHGLMQGEAYQESTNARYSEIEIHIL
ncbi:Heterokaryon incompatibility protein 6, OR allele 1 [Colletotrichum chlorophyti]|uniref:Heterokaryon incompatibility protein 6, OR allele 1 n=1 Tax=Colletotrichum chlorophyti TaxID=708187 RepID=A0A1Q8S7E2_9PEZI|nr:Heterokaryon incompatibility protein 6, OR allele 1 [Colletotrichum chlorophyti]